MCKWFKGSREERFTPRVVFQSKADAPSLGTKSQNSKGGFLCWKPLPLCNHNGCGLETTRAEPGTARLAALGLRATVHCSSLWMGRAPQNAHVKSAQDASFPSLFLSFLADILAAANAVPQSSSEGIALFAGALCKSHSHPTPQQLALLPSSKIHLFPALVCLMLHCRPVCPLCAIPSPLSVSGTCDYNETALRQFCYFTWQRDFANVTKGP